MSNGDYVVEQGVTDGWTWEKWNSGKAIMHAQVWTNYGFTDTAALKSYTLPFSITNYRPLHNIASAGWLWKMDKVGIIHTSDTQISILAYSTASNYSGTDLPLDVYIVGTWK